MATIVGLSVILLVVLVMLLLAIILMVKKRLIAVLPLAASLLALLILVVLAKDAAYDFYGEHVCPALQRATLRAINDAQLDYKDDPARGAGHYTANLVALNIDWSELDVVNDDPLIVQGDCRLLVRIYPDYAEVMTTQKFVRECIARVEYGEYDMYIAVERERCD